MFPIAQPNNFIRNRSLYDGNEIFISNQKTQNKNAKKKKKLSQRNCLLKDHRWTHVVALLQKEGSVSKEA